MYLYFVSTSFLSHFVISPVFKYFVGVVCKCSISTSTIQRTKVVMSSNTRVQATIVDNIILCSLAWYAHDVVLYVPYTCTWCCFAHLLRLVRYALYFDQLDVAKSTSFFMLTCARQHIILGDLKQELVIQHFRKCKFQTSIEQVMIMLVIFFFFFKTFEYKCLGDKLYIGEKY